jgi:hypothetical protein
LPEKLTEIAMNIIEELEKMPKDLKYEVTFRALAEMVKAGTLVLARLSEIADRLEEKERHLSQLTNKMEVLGWETAIRNEMERQERKEGWKKPTTKKQLKRSS